MTATFFDLALYAGGIFILFLTPARQPGFDIHKLEEAWAEFEKART